MNKFKNLYTQIKNFFINTYINLSSFFQNIFRSRFYTDMYIAQSHVVASVHEKTFSRYKNIYTGKDIAIIATGPSLNKYKPIETVANIGVNSAIKYNNIKLDYLFINDYVGLKKCIDEVEKHPEIKKFYGRLPEHPYGMKECYSKAAIIPESIMIRHKASKYYIYVKIPKHGNHFHTEIDKTWLVDGGSVAMSAIQFALFTNPRRIYLVGCDCSNGYFDANKPEKLKFNNIYLKSWIELKEFADLYYPETEIISVNPVGLKDLFSDIFQE